LTITSTSRYGQVAPRQATGTHAELTTAGICAVLNLALAATALAATAVAAAAMATVSVWRR